MRSPCSYAALRYVHCARPAGLLPRELRPEAVYFRLKQMGMDLVTVTDYDSIDAALTLSRYPDFFASEEVTVTMPSGNEAHMAVYGLNERQHLGIQQRRRDLPSLLAYLREQRLPLE